MLGLDVSLSSLSGENTVIEKIEREPEVVNMSDSFGTTILIEAAALESVVLIKCLCEMGANANSKNDLGETPLINVVRTSFFRTNQNSLSKAKILLEHGADPNIVSYDGCSALHQAIIFGQIVLVKLFLQYEGDPNVRIKDPPSHENALELCESKRFKGSDSERQEIQVLLEKKDNWGRADLILFPTSVSELAISVVVKKGDIF